MKKVKYTVIDDNAFEEQKSSHVTKFNNNQNNTSSSTVNNTFSIRSQLYQAIADIYKNFILTKTNQYENFGVYKALIDSNIYSDIRYIVAIVENDNRPIGSEVPLSELNWVSFQTRMTKNGKEFKQFNMKAKNYTLPNRSILHDRITKILETKEKSVYSTDNLPISLEIVHSTENDVFTDKGTVVAALELYQTVIAFNE
jgi:hypothetical protein